MKHKNRTPQGSYVLHNPRRMLGGLGVSKFGDIGISTPQLEFEQQIINGLIKEIEKPSVAVHKSHFIGRWSLTCTTIPDSRKRASVYIDFATAKVLISNDDFSLLHSTSTPVKEVNLADPEAIMKIAAFVAFFLR